MTAVWGLLADLTSLRIAIAAAGILLMASVFWLPWREHSPEPVPEQAGDS